MIWVYSKKWDFLVIVIEKFLSSNPAMAPCKQSYNCTILQGYAWGKQKSKPYSSSSWQTFDAACFFRRAALCWFQCERSVCFALLPACYVPTGSQVPTWYKLQFAIARPSLMAWVSFPDMGNSVPSWRRQNLTVATLHRSCRK